MIRVLLDPRQTLDDVAPDLPERVPVQPGDIVVERNGSSFTVFRYEPGAAETGALVFASLQAALAAARSADARRDGLPASPTPQRRPSCASGVVIDLRPYLARKAARRFADLGS